MSFHFSLFVCSESCELFPERQTEELYYLKLFFRSSFDSGKFYIKDRDMRYESQIVINPLDTRMHLLIDKLIKDIAFCSLEKFLPSITSYLSQYIAESVSNVGNATKTFQRLGIATR